MNLHAKKITEGGKDYVRIPAREYEKLLEMLEDAEDIRDARASLARIAEGESTLPASLVHALIYASPGEKIALRRKHLGMTRDALALKVGVSGGSITMIETGKRKGTIAVFGKIASVLGCDIDDLI